MYSLVIAVSHIGLNWHVMLLLQYIVWQGESSCSRVIDGTMEAAAWVERTAKYCDLEINC